MEFSRARTDLGRGRLHGSGRGEVEANDIGGADVRIGVDAQRRLEAREEKELLRRVCGAEGPWGAGVYRGTSLRKTTHQEKSTPPPKTTRRGVGQDGRRGRLVFIDAAALPAFSTNAPMLREEKWVDDT